MNKKKWIACLLALCLGLSACGGESQKKEENIGKKTEEAAGVIDRQFAGQTLKLTSFTKDMEYAAKAFEKAYACKVELAVKDSTEFAAERERLLAGSEGADIYTIEAAEMQDWLTAEALLPLTDVDAEHYAPYAIAYATDSTGALRALTWTATPVNLYYRRSAAQAALGNDSPEAVTEALWAPESLTDLAGKLQTAGYKIFSNVGDMRAFYGVSDKTETAVLSPQERVFLTNGRQMETNYQLAGLEPWSADWFKGMYGEAVNSITGKKIEVFGYVMPSWGKSYVLEKAGNKKEASDTEKNPTWGDWAAAACPAASFSDGIWLGIAANSQRAEMAKAFLVYVTQNQELLQEWLKKTQELPAFLPVLESYQLEMEDSFLGGQKIMPLYIETIKAIPAKSAEQLRQEKEYYQKLEAYLKGEIATLEELQTALAPAAVEPNTPAVQ